MVFQRLYQRSIHHRSLLSRQVKVGDEGISVKPGVGNGASTTTSAAQSTTTARASTTSTAGPGTTSAASSTTSSTRAASTTASTSSSTQAAQTTAPRTTTSRTITSASSSRTTSRSTTASPSATDDAITADTPQSSGTGSLVGIIGGVMIGILILSLIIFFFVRRYKKKKEEEEAFSAAEFRKSAVMLDDDAINAVSARNPRPPTMIERHVAHAPAIGGYQYDQGPFQGGPARPYPDQGYGGPMPGYGPPGGYGYAVQEPQYPQHHPYPYGHPQPPPADELPNPFMASAEGPGPMGYDAQSGAPGTPVLSRQASVPEGPAGNNGQYVEMSRDTGAPLPPALVAGGSSGPSQATPRPHPAGGDAARPISTAYDPEDAYGGM